MGLLAIITLVAAVALVIVGAAVGLVVICAAKLAHLYEQDQIDRYGSATPSFRSPR